MVSMEACRLEWPGKYLKASDGFVDHIEGLVVTGELCVGLTQRISHENHGIVKIEQEDLMILVSDIWCQPSYD